MNFSLIIDAGIDVSGWKEDRIPTMGAKLRIGKTGTIHQDKETYFLHRRAPTVLWLTRDPAGVPQPRRTSDDFSWAAALWQKLLAGADTPKGRAQLAYSMLGKGGVPCGVCKTHWAQVLRGLTKEHVATPESFHRWVWDRRQDIAAKKGKPVWEYPGYAEK